LELEKKLEVCAEEKETYAQSCLDKTKGARGLHGSSMSEQNHSSTLCHLNDGHTKNNKYCEQPITLVKDLFARQQRHVLIMNKILFDQETEMLSEIETLVQAERSESNIDLLKAARKLCKFEYEAYHVNRKRSDELYQMYQDGDGICIACIEHPNAPPRRFTSIDDDCSCEERITKENQCCHLIKLRGDFLKVTGNFVT